MHYDKAKADEPIPKMQVRYDGTVTANTDKWQNYLPNPQKLYISQGRLYTIDLKGSPVKRKSSNNATGIRKYTYYTKD